MRTRGGFFKTAVQALGYGLRLVPQEFFQALSLLCHPGSKFEEQHARSRRNNSNQGLEWCGGLKPSFPHLQTHRSSKLTRSLPGLKCRTSEESTGAGRSCHHCSLRRNTEMAWERLLLTCQWHSPSEETEAQEGLKVPSRREAPGRTPLQGPNFHQVNRLQVLSSHPSLPFETKKLQETPGLRFSPTRLLGNTKRIPPCFPLCLLESRLCVHTLGTILNCRGGRQGISR